jgi:hypothetical protein
MRREMPVESLTTQTISQFACPPGKDREVFWEDKTPGFGVVVFKSGRKTFVVQFFDGKQSRRTTLGTADALTLQEARTAARKRLGQARRARQPLHKILTVEPEAARDVRVSVRFPRKTLAAVDKFAADRARNLSIPFTRSEAILMLVTEMLDLRRGTLIPGRLHVSVVEKKKSPPTPQS